MMHGPEKSDPAIVATRPANKVGTPGRGAGGAKGEDRGGTRAIHARSGRRAGPACHRGWTV